MRIVTKTARVDEQKCAACGECVLVCPVEAVSLQKRNEKRVAVVAGDECLDCKLCFARCPEHAISMIDRALPLQIGTSLYGVGEKAVTDICEAAHMYPEQVVCYCHRVQAREIAAAILKGAKTPEDVARMTGARTGCGTLCITGVIRLLRAAGLELARAPGYQWYGIDFSIWSLPREIREKYRSYYLEEDLAANNRVFPGSEKQ